MRLEKLKNIADLLQGKERKSRAPMTKPQVIKRANNRTMSYTERHKGQWHKGEYPFSQIQRAQDADSYLQRAILRKVNRFISAGWEYTGKNPEAVDWIKRRLAEISWASEKTEVELLGATVHDLVRYKNCMWAKVRDKRSAPSGKEVRFRRRTAEPIGGYFPMPFETLEFETKINGNIKRIKQTMPSGKKRIWQAHEIVHFHWNRKNGFAVGTPDIFPAIDDIELLRRIEENVEDLIESNLFPLFHYTIGTDKQPEQFTPDGRLESDIVKQEIEYMPAGGVLVTGHRHQIDAIGSESKALRIEPYLTYFQKRVFAGIGVSSVDLGIGGDANRSTAHTMSKAFNQDVEALQVVVKAFLERYIISELLLEGGFNPLDPYDAVEVKFGVVDREERTALENQVAQLFTQGLVTLNEARRLVGFEPMTDEDLAETYYRLYREPLALAKAGIMGGDALAALPHSNVTSENVNKQLQLERSDKPSGPISSKTGSERQSANRARPSNQHGTRSGPKLNKDQLLDLAKTAYARGSRKSGLLVSDPEAYLDVREWLDDRQTLDRQFEDRLEITGAEYASTVASSMRYRYDRLDNRYRDLFYNKGLLDGLETQNIEVERVELIDGEDCPVSSLDLNTGRIISWI